MLEGKTILITGSSRGIGAAIAKGAKKYGAKVILHGKTESAELKKLASELRASYIFCDVTNEADIKDAIKDIGHVDILINNAGISISKPFLELNESEWNEVWKTNVMGTVHFSKTIIPGMLIKKSGRIINISSIKGLPHASGRSAFAASKAAVITLTASMAKEFAPHILINCVAPGFTETETTKEAWGERIHDQIKESPLQRAAQPEEIAETVLFLASERSSFTTGQTFIVDGGYSISG